MPQTGLSPNLTDHQYHFHTNRIVCRLHTPGMTRNDYLTTALKYYDVQPDGRIKKNTTNSGRPARSEYVSTHKNNKGYLHVSLSVEGEKRTVPVHRLVAFRFLGPSSLHVDHIDGDKTNNSPENLRYVSQAQNNREHFKLDDKPGRASIDKNTVRMIRGRLKSEKVADIARDLGLPYNLVFNIHTGYTWGWLK